MSPRPVPPHTPGWCGVGAPAITTLWNTIGFLSSVVKSGESWSRYCDEAIGEAMAARDQLMDAVEGRCSRCHQRIEDFRPPDGGMTAGYYAAAGWLDFANPGEVYICDACMWKDPRYIAVYGDHNIEHTNYN